jgi:hypothetical protein
MAKHDHCVICDYTEKGGSGIAGISPGRNGKVRLYQGDMICDSCCASVGSNIMDMRKVDKEDAD